MGWVGGGQYCLIGGISGPLWSGHPSLHLLFFSSIMQKRLFSMFDKIKGPGETRARYTKPKGGRTMV